MSNAHDPGSGKNSYIIDAESGTEMARLMIQDRFVTKGMGGLLPELDAGRIQGLRDILDIGCGPGGWVLDMAYTYPKKQVTGIDISSQMTEYARTQAWTQGLNNAHFRVVDALKPFDFPDASFDMVNMRSIVGFMPKGAWPTFLQECKRIIRSGGIIRLTESEWGITNSEACERLIGMCTRALQLSGRGYSPDGRSIGIQPWLARFLRQAGCVNVQQVLRPRIIEAGQPDHDAFYQDFLAAFSLLQPFLCMMKVTTEEEFELLYQQALAEIMLNDFCLVGDFLTAWGEVA